MSNQGPPGGPPRWPGHSAHGHRSPSPYRGPPPPRPGWASPIPLRMTQSPPPFLIRPMVGGQSPIMGQGSPRAGSPIPPFGPPRWSPAPGTPGPHPHHMHMPMPMTPPPHMMAPRPFFRPIIPSPSPPVGLPTMPPEGYQDVFSLQPSYDMEFVYPPGMDPDSLRRQISMQSQEEEDGGPTTAQIIAAQSQDYVDERLAEYQATIQHLQGSVQSFLLYPTVSFCLEKRQEGRQPA